jgi:beta-alanine--pyruvate transaminase
MTGPDKAIELFHGYTYSGHPMAAAAGLATQAVYQEEGLFQRAAELAPVFEDAVHSLKDARHVIDSRNLGLMGAIELQARDGEPTARAIEAFTGCFDAGVLVRTTGDTIALSPPLIIEESHIDQIVSTIRKVLETID